MDGVEEEIPTKGGKACLSASGGKLALKDYVVPPRIPACRQAGLSASGGELVSRLYVVPTGLISNFWAEDLKVILV